MCILVLSCDHTNELSDSVGNERGSTVYGVTVPTEPNRLHHFPHGTDRTLSPSPWPSQSVSLSLWTNQDSYHLPHGPARVYRFPYGLNRTLSPSPWSSQGVSISLWTRQDSITFHMVHPGCITFPMYYTGLLSLSP
jgi:hypothetical protein